jgi:small subunit ribosomal protein S1
MKNLYSITPKYLNSITKNTSTGAPARPRAQAPVEPEFEEEPREDENLEAPSTAGKISDSWWASVMRDEVGDRRPTTPVNTKRQAPEQRPMVPHDWSAARELYESDGIAELKVTGVNRGGLLVENEQLRGFIPLSHLIGVPSLQSEEERQGAMHQRMGLPIQAKIIEFDPEKGRVVFSERAAQSAPGRRAELLSNIQVGDKLQGEVTNITNFGVFIDLGGMEGLVHLSEISWGRVHNPADFVTINQKVDVEVISVDRDQGRVALSLKRLLPDPWATVPDRYLIGDWVDCTITHVTNFGAFASLEEGVEGLIHVSELTEGSFSHPRNVVHEGESMKARVISVDSHARRLALSLRRDDDLPAGSEPLVMDESTDGFQG